MKINRHEVLQELTVFTQADSGVIIGIPGIGKTHLLKQLVVDLADRKVPACLIRLDALMDGGDADISGLLGMKETNWVEQLAKLQVPASNRGVLIFDGFDALRDEALKKRVLRHIADAKKKLPEWSVIASVRTYDALKSPRLIELFPYAASTDQIHCRKYTIPYLNDEELQDVLSRYDRLEALFGAGNDRLRQLFRVPFFLSLLNVILKSAPEEESHLSVIKSEIELLDMYWSKVVLRVDPVIITESFLTRLTEHMVKDKQLHVDKHQYLSSVHNSTALVADQLLSENVLAQQGVQSVKIGYAHNILFDYAVSRLIIKDTSEGIRKFIEEDPSRVLFLRPSFIYFFARLWYNQRDLFWKLYRELSFVNDSTIRMFNKLVPSTVFVQEFDQSEDLPAEEYSTSGSLRTKDILQGFQYLESKASILQQVKLLESVSHSLKIVFVGEFAIVLRRLLDKNGTNGNAEVLNLAGSAARNLFDFSFSKGVEWEPLAAYHAIPMLGITYKSDVELSRKRIELVLDVMKNPGFNIALISTLLDKLDHILQSDPDTINEIYLKVFAQGDLGDERTTVRASVIMQFSMSRKDDFNLCRYKLKEFFPKYIVSYPKKAVATSLELVHLHYSQKDKSRAKSKDFPFPMQFDVDGVQCVYSPGASLYASEYSTPEELKLLDLVFHYFDKLITGQGDEDALRELLRIYLSKAEASASWKRFFKWAARHPTKLHHQLFSIFLQPIVLYWWDTIQEIGEMLEAFSPLYDSDQLLQIEKAIHSLPDYVSDKEQDACKKRVIRLLSRIPNDYLQLPESKRIFEDNDTIANTPSFEFTSSSEPYTTRMFISDSGVDVADPMNDSFITIQEELETFCTTYLNENPTPDVYKNFLDKAIAVFDQVNSNPELDHRIIEALLTSIASTCKIVLRSDLYSKAPGEHLSTNYHTTIETVLLKCIARHSEADSHAEANYSPGSIHSTTPKSEAAGGLIYLWKLSENPNLLPIIEQTSKDRNPIARYGVLGSINLLRQSHPDVFWQIILERLANDSDNFIKANLLLTLENKFIYANDVENLLRALELAQTQVGSLDSDNIYLKHFFLVCLSFHRITGDDNVRKIINDTLYRHFSAALTFVFITFQIIEPANWYRNFEDEEDIARSQRLVDLLLALVDRCQEIIGIPDTNEPIEQNVVEAVRILGQIVARAYYSLQVNKRIYARSSSSERMISGPDKSRFYSFIRPVLDKIFEVACRANFMEPVTAYHFIQILADSIDFDPRYSLFTIKKINELVAGSNFAYDQGSVSETVKFTEQLLADHREILNDPDSFAALTDLLNIYANAGWSEALELLQRMDDIFR